MNQYDYKYKTTRLIWGAVLIMFLAVMAAGYLSSGLSLGHFIIAFFILIFGVVATDTVSKSSGAGAAEESSKQKRSASLDTLIARLSDEEREQLYDSLDTQRGGYALSDDGEIVQKQRR